MSDTTTYTYVPYAAHAGGQEEESAPIDMPGNAMPHMQDIESTYNSTS